MTPGPERAARFEPREKIYTAQRPSNKIIIFIHTGQPTPLQNDNMQKSFCSPKALLGCQGFEADN